MKKGILPVLALLATSLSAGFLAWLFCLHGTRGLLHVEKIGWLAVIFLVILGLLPLAIWLFHRHQPKKHLLATAVVIISVISIILPICSFAYLNGFPLASPTPKAPLLIPAGTGAYGIPDIIVRFMSTKSTSSTLSWGRDNITNTIEEPEARRDHIFILSDLTPGSRYMYRVDGGTTYYFTTPSLTQPLHFAVGSDAHFGAGDSRPDLSEKMLAQIADPAHGYKYFFSLGDNVEYGFRTEEWQAALAAFSSTAATVPVAYIPGNHDCLFTGINRYLDYCSSEGIRYRSGNRLWHRIDIDNVHFLILDVEWSAESITAAQKTWLEDELKSIPASDWTIVMNHGYYYASGSVVRGRPRDDDVETIDRLVPLFEKYDVDLVFSGHAHQMELLEQNGITYIIAGAFGGIPDPEREHVSPASIWYASGQYGFIDVTVADDRTDIVFTGPDGQVLHRASIAR
jgi:acid phosphatase type 7